MSEIIGALRKIQRIAYIGDIDCPGDDASVAKGACYEIDMICRAVLSEYDSVEDGQVGV
jgi:radical SAM superfamily enzyme